MIKNTAISWTGKATNVVFFKSRCLSAPGYFSVVNLEKGFNPIHYKNALLIGKALDIDPELKWECHCIIVQLLKRLDKCG